MTDADERMLEQRALDFCAKNKGKTFVLEGQPGHFEVLEDMNCCAPTNNVLFAFVMESSRKVFTAAGLLRLAAENHLL